MASNGQRSSDSASLKAAEDRFIAVWGQMAGAWGISRTMAEVHALLYITGTELCTDDIMERLQISRGNASMSTRALVDWNIVSRVNKRGDRKEYFTAEQDVWALFRAIVRERMNREVDPLLASLYEIRDMTGVDAKSGDDKSAKSQAKAHRERIDAMLDFFETLEKFGQRFVSPTGRGLQMAATLLSKLPDLSGNRSGSQKRSAQRHAGKSGSAFVGGGGGDGSDGGGGGDE